MKKVIIAGTALLLLGSCGVDKQEMVDITYNDDNINVEQSENMVQAAELSETEKEGLILMREEEKLARDVYFYFYNTYGSRIFGNIDDSEEKHKSAVKPLLDFYGLEDPIKDDTPGVYTSQEMTNLYNDLKSKGEESLVEALKVGAMIEDLDIKDLRDLISETDKQDIIVVYGNLLNGSYNHLRSYIKNLDREGESYTPQFISEELFNEILSGTNGNGRK